MAHGWEGEHVRLVALDQEKHFENALRWINDPEVTATLAFGGLPQGRKAQEEWFQNAANSKGDAVFAIEKLDGKHIGMSGLHRIDFQHGWAMSGSYIAAHVDRRQGFGSEAALIRAHYAFEVLGLRMIESGFIVGNIASQKMQEKLGAEVVGVVKDRYWRRGAYRDLVTMVLYREAFWAKHGKGFVF